MRFMDIPPFARRIEIPDFDHFIKARLSQTVVYWPEQAVQLLGYMGWPNDPLGRAEAKRTLRAWGLGIDIPLGGLRQIQMRWARVADIFSLHYDLAIGDHQKRRGGPSIGKAIALANATSRSRGVGIANLWHCWKRYKDVAHLVTAATIICDHVRSRGREALIGADGERMECKPFGDFGLEFSQLQPFTIAMMMPDFVIAAALWWQNYGLAYIPHSRSEPTTDLATAWRIPENINAAAIAPPKRKVRRQDIRILNSRRAGNRGRANRRKT